MNGNIQDTQSICNAEFIDWEKLKGKTVLVTGATGLIGTTLVNGLAYANRKQRLNITVICIVRNAEKARKKLDTDVVFKVVSLDEKIEICEPVDFIIHAANPTSSSFFVNNPVETIKIAVNSTMNLLEFAKEKKVDGFVYLSSMEIYGLPVKGHAVKENEVAGFNTTVTRNCYPQSKQICEMLCKSYHSEYGVPTKIVRLTQTFGPGVEYNDGRVFAEFMRCAMEKKDIVLHTTGRTERCYLYTIDAVTAIFTVLTKGEPGEAYTAANPETYCSILEMAQMVANDIANRQIKVNIEVDDVDRGYASELYMKLDTSKIEDLGWKASTNLKEMFEHMIAACCVEK